MIYLSQETLALARRLAAARGLSLEDAVKLALEQSAREAGLTLPGMRYRDLSAEAVAARKAKLEAFADAIANMAVLDQRSPRQIMDDSNAL
jgi:antitoxin VapB